jgi:hypothetical protein
MMFSRVVNWKSQAGFVQWRSRKIPRVSATLVRALHRGQYMLSLLLLCSAD